MITYQPKASMCKACEHVLRDCSTLPFATYQVIKIYRDGTKAVRCGGFQKNKNEATK
jgi:hypothetical protein